MSIRYMQRILDDKSYYITNCYNPTDLLRIQADIVKAREELKEIETLIAQQYNKTQQVIEYKEIIVNRYKPYKGNIDITVYINKYKTLDGVRLDKNDMDHTTHRHFSGKEKKQAFEYANKLKSEYHIPIIERGF